MREKEWVGEKETDRKKERELRCEAQTDKEIAIERERE